MNAKPSVAMVQGEMCQCPLGLIPHFYSTREKWSWYTIIPCQCPLGLIPHFYKLTTDVILPDDIECQCPLGLIPHFYGPPSKT